MIVGQPTRRPGGRTAKVTGRVNAAVLELLVEGGYAACTVAAVAERAGVERSTLYRRYADRWAMMIDAILGLAAEEFPPGSLGSFAEDLRLLIGRTAEILATPLGPAVWAVGAALRAGSAPGQGARFWTERSKQIMPIFEAAKARGELARDADVEEIMSFSAGAVHYRMLVMGRPVDSATLDRIVERTCGLFCRSAASVKVEPAVSTAEIQ